MSVLFKAYCRVYQKTIKLAMNFLDWSEPELLKGAGAVKKLPSAVKAKNVDNVLVVTDKGLTGLHLLDGLYESLDAQGVKYTVYDGVQPNPTIDNIETAVELYQNNCCNGIIAFGGGSPMDCAKACGARIVRPKKTVPEGFVRKASALSVTISSTRSVMIRSSRAFFSGSANTIAAVFLRSKAPSGVRISPPKAAASSESTGLPFSVRLREMASASTTS